MLENVDISWTAILVAGVVNMVLGWIWYMPGLFGKSWMAGMGRSEGEMKAQPGPLLVMFIVALVTAYILTHFVQMADAMTFWEGAQTGLWLSIGFRVLPSISATLASKGNWNVWAVNNGYWVVSLMLMGGVLATM